MPQSSENKFIDLLTAQVHSDIKPDRNGHQTPACWAQKAFGSVNLSLQAAASEAVLNYWKYPGREHRGQETPRGETTGSAREGRNTGCGGGMRKERCVPTAQLSRDHPGWGDCESAGAC